MDVGCACGGLGAALSERFILNSYTGVDINKDAISWASNNQRLSIPTKFIATDILDQKLKDNYDTVVSLSCADWNIETSEIINYCWQRLRPAGYFVISLRLTKKKSVNNIKKSYQYIDFFGKDEHAEIANYVVFNFKDAIRMLVKLEPAPDLIGTYGYWGVPSKTAVTLFDRLIFSVFYIRKRLNSCDNENIKGEFNLPIDIFSDNI